MFLIDDPLYIPLSIKYRYKTVVPDTKGAAVFLFSTNSDEMREKHFQNSNDPCPDYKNPINTKPKTNRRWLKYRRLTAGRAPPFLTF